MDYLSPAERKLFESFEIPLIIYDYVDGKVVTVLVSDGFCELKNMDRRELAQRLNASMFNMVHPDDAGKLAHQGDAFARKQADYDVLFRARNADGQGYHICHTMGFWQTVASGRELAFLFYIDVSKSLEDIRRLSEEYITCRRSGSTSIQLQTFRIPTIFTSFSKRR